MKIEVKNEPVCQAIIVKVYEDSLRGYLKDEEKISKMKAGMVKIPPYLTTPNEIDDYKEKYLSNIILVVVYKVKVDAKTDKVVSEWFNIPNTGIKNSMLYQIMKYHKLPVDTEEWIGKKVTAQVNDAGYFRILK